MHDHLTCYERTFSNIWRRGEHREMRRAVVIFVAVAAVVIGVMASSVRADQPHADGVRVVWIPTLWQMPTVQCWGWFPVVRRPQIIAGGTG
jgi:hypothetical protein